MLRERTSNFWKLFTESVAKRAAQAKPGSRLSIDAEREKSMAELEGGYLAEYIIEEEIRAVAAGVRFSPYHKGPPFARKLADRLFNKLLDIQVKDLEKNLSDRAERMILDFGPERASELHIQGLSLQRIFWTELLEKEHSPMAQEYGGLRLDTINGEIAALTQPQPQESQG